MVTVLRVLVMILCAIVSFGYLRAIVYYSGVFMKTPQILSWFGFGALIYLVFWLFFFSKRDKFWSVFEHELTHVLFAILFFRQVHTFKVERGKGGEVKITGSNFIVGLSPYFFPLMALPVVLLKPSIAIQHQWILNGVLGFTVMFHVISLMQELNPKQPDISNYGLLFSLFVIIAFNIFFLGICYSSMRGLWGDMSGFLQMGYMESQRLVENAWRVFYHQSVGRYFGG